MSFLYILNVLERIFLSQSSLDFEGEIVGIVKGDKYGLDKKTRGHAILD